MTSRNGDLGGLEAEAKLSARDRLRGCLLGLATGDAIGTTVEFRPRGTFQPLTDMIGGGPFHLRPGQWTDDTSMALCLAESLVEQGGFDARDQMERYVRWWRDGYLEQHRPLFRHREHRPGCSPALPGIR